MTSEWLNASIKRILLIVYHASFAKFGDIQVTSLQIEQKCRLNKKSALFLFSGILKCCKKIQSTVKVLLAVGPYLDYEV